MNKPQSLRDLVQLAIQRHQTSGRQLAFMAQREGFAITVTTINHFKAGTYKYEPSTETIRAIAWLAGVSDEVAFTAAGQPVPGPPLADELPPGTDNLSPKSRKAVIEMLRVLIDLEASNHDDQEQPETNPSGERATREAGGGGGVVEGQKTVAEREWEVALAAFVSADVLNRSAWADDFSAESGADPSESLGHVVRRLPQWGLRTHIWVLGQPESSRVLSEEFGPPSSDSGHVLGWLRAQLAHDWMYMDARIGPDGVEDIASWDDYRRQMLQDAHEVDLGAVDIVWSGAGGLSDLASAAATEALAAFRRRSAGPVTPEQVWLDPEVQEIVERFAARESEGARRVNLKARAHRLLVNMVNHGELATVAERANSPTESSRQHSPMTHGRKE